MKNKSAFTPQPSDNAPSAVLRDEDYMRLAIAEALVASDAGEAPVGAVLVGEKGEILAACHNLTETLGEATAHAEMLAIREGGARLGVKRLLGATLYVTLEPCPMCAGAIVLSRIRRVVFGASDPKSGAMGSVYAVGVDGRLNHTPELRQGVLEGECGRLLRDFFKALRAEKP
ncbi:MAG: tRNA adenosine(34) deaminase TadA [Deltaproteobacteria bacterium]